MTKITAVCGPPGSGKSTYVSQHKMAGDLIFDWDKLLSALTGCAEYERPPWGIDLYRPIFDAVVHYIRQSNNRCKKAWIIAGLPKVEQRQFLRNTLRADIVLLKVPAEECVARTTERPSGIDWRSAVDQWWREFTE